MSHFWPHFVDIPVLFCPFCPNKKGVIINAFYIDFIELIFVAGVGFEPTTFGL